MKRYIILILINLIILTGCTKEETINETEINKEQLVETTDEYANIITELKLEYPNSVLKNIGMPTIKVQEHSDTNTDVHLIDAGDFASVVMAVTPYDDENMSANTEITKEVINKINSDISETVLTHMVNILNEEPLTTEIYMDGEQIYNVALTKYRSAKHETVNVQIFPKYSSKALPFLIRLKYNDFKANTEYTTASLTGDTGTVVVNSNISKEDVLYEIELHGDISNEQETALEYMLKIFYPNNYTDLYSKYTEIVEHTEQILEEGIFDNRRYEINTTNEDNKLVAKLLIFSK